MSLERASLGIVLLGALGLRLHGLAFGLPAVYNPDEVAILSRALAFATGDFNPRNFLYPSFFFYVLFAWVAASFAPAWLLGVAASRAEFERLFFLDPTWVYLAARSLSVACGFATVAATWWLARRWFGRVAGIAAALFLAVAPIAVRDAHYVKHDVPVTLAMVLAIWAMAPLVERDAAVGVGTARGWPWRRLALAGAACGVAFSTHYYAVFLAVPLVIAVWIALRRRGLRPVLAGLAIAMLAALVTFLALSPYLLPEWRTALRDITANRQIVVDRAAQLRGTAWLPSAGDYARMLWQEGTGWPVLLLASVGLVVAWRHAPRAGLLLVAFPVPFLVFISNTVAASRYLNPVLPFIAVLAGAAVAWLAGTAGRPDRSAPSVDPGHSTAPPSRRLAARRIAVLLLVVLAALPGLRHSLRTGAFFGQTDTRTLALRFIETHVPAGTTVLVQPYSVPLQQSRESLIEALTATLGSPDRASTKFQRRLALDPYPSPAYRVLYLGDGGLDADRIYIGYAEVQGPDPLAVLREHEVEVVVWKRYDPPDPMARALVAALEREARRLAVFSPYADGATSTRGRPAPFLHNTDTPIDRALVRPGPIVEIWGLEASAARR